MSTDASRDEIELLERSLADARAEHARGDLDDASLTELEAREGARLAAARARLDGASASAVTRAASGDPARRPRRRRLLVVSTLCAALVCAVVVLAATDPFASTPRPAPLDAAGRVAALLITAEGEVARGHQLQALTLYDAVLRLEPSNGEALIESGWLRYELGLGRHDAAWIREGAARLARAVVVAPSQAAAHLYDGIVLLQRRDRAGAITQLLRAEALPETAYQQSITALFLVQLHYRPT
jgi:tetratricopeptide (TPR) repeat protein